jgi:hypothetical protein
LPDKGQVGIGEAGTQSLGTVKALGFDGMTNRIRMDTEGLGNGANFPMLGKNQCRI